MSILFHHCQAVLDERPSSVIRGYQQQDAHEFMHYLLDRVHNELLLTKMAYNGKNTIVTGIFGGILESQVCWLNLYFRLKFSMLKFLRFML